MNKENIHQTMDLPRFEPWTTENWFDEKGDLHSRELFLTDIKLKKGSLETYIQNLQQQSTSHRPYFLEFYSPAGEKMKAEVRGYIIPEDQDPIFDHLTFLVSLSSDQVLILFPNNFGPEDFGY